MRVTSGTDHRSDLAVTWPTLVCVCPHLALWRHPQLDTVFWWWPHLGWNGGPYCLLPTAETWTHKHTHAEKICCWLWAINHSPRKSNKYNKWSVFMQSSALWALNINVCIHSSHTYNRITSWDSVIMYVLLCHSCTFKDRIRRSVFCAVKCLMHQLSH